MPFPSLIQFGDLALFLLRLALGAVFLYHAFPKLTNTKGMATMMGWPTSKVLLLGTVETVGALSVILGISLQIGALALAVVMLGALYFKIMVWRTPFAAFDKTGWELDLILLATTLPLIATGGGAWTLL